MFWQHAMQGSQDAMKAYGPGGGSMLRKLFKAGLEDMGSTGTGGTSTDAAPSASAGNGILGSLGDKAYGLGQDARNAMNSITGMNIDFNDPTGLKQMGADALSGMNKYLSDAGLSMDSLSNLGFGFGE